MAITGAAKVGQTLNGAYSYFDDDGDLEGTSLFRWLRGGVAISGATAQAYSLVDADEGALITFEVTPVAQTGLSPGVAVQSAAVGPIYVEEVIIIIDNGEPGTSETGTWNTSGGEYPYGDSSVYSKDPGATYTFEASVNSFYEVSMWWSEWSSRCTNVSVSIYDGDTLLKTTSVDQQTGAGDWNVLGTFGFGSGTAKLVITAQDSDCSTCADAARFISKPPAELDYIEVDGPRVVLDNSTAQYLCKAYYTDGAILMVVPDDCTVNCPAFANISQQGLLTSFDVDTQQPCQVSMTYEENGETRTGTFDLNISDSVFRDNDGPGTSSTGTWDSSSGPDPYGGSSLFSRDVGATYSFDAPASGFYLVSVWWTQYSSRCSAVPIEIYDGNTLLDTLNVDQRTNGGQWVPLGTYEFTGTARVVINAARSDCSTCADAARFIETLPPENIYAARINSSYDIELLDKIIAMMQDLGAYEDDGKWVYTNPELFTTYVVSFPEEMEALKQALYEEDSHVMLVGHSNYGLGALLATEDEMESEIITDVYYIDDDRILNWSSLFVRIGLEYLRTEQTYPNFWINYKDGTSAIMPYVHGDPKGDPAYNYYISYQVPGDPTYYKVESPRKRAIQRFSDSRRSAWFSEDGSEPDPNNPDHRKYYITNPTPWYSRCQTTGNWTTIRTGTELFKENYYSASAGDGSSQVRWNFMIDRPGDYNVFAWWSASSSNTNNARYIVNHSLGSTPVVVNQMYDGGQWNELDAFSFAPVPEWYESRGHDPNLLSLDTDLVGGNDGKKAKLQSSLCGSAYLSQSLSPPQTHEFSVQWDIYVDSILDNADLDRGALMMLGDDEDNADGPNSADSERFVFMAFHRENGGESGTMNLIAREPGNAYDDSAAWRTLEADLAMDQWHTVRVDCDLDTDTYDVYVNGALASGGAGVMAFISKDEITHMSFAQWNDGSGTFYVDNVEGPPGASAFVADSNFNASDDSDDLRNCYNSIYSVDLTNDASGGRVVADAIKVTHVDNPPEIIQADFNARNRHGPVPLEVDFDNESTGDFTSRYWKFGDGGENGSRDDITHIYTSPGTYSVTLTITGPMGTSTKTKTSYITVGDVTPPLQAEFSASGQEGTIPQTTRFQDRSSGEIESWSWDFDDDGIEDSTERNPRHTYYLPGNYTVALTVTDIHGATHTETKENFVIARIYDNSIDNVDYPKPHYSNKTMVMRKEMELDKEQLGYARLLYDSCNSGNYFLDTFNRGIVFYTLYNSDGKGFVPYLKAYLEGKSDQEIWEAIQAADPVYDFYDFNKYPWEQ
ncbi:MAG: PKD domain-containing protein [Deltaproteobacteria bacterium]|nr:PKD domain-containing protein [Deltaproteobacteria bacterium]